tara:strand:+ start:97 stop:279 length:183 start_codon:yes stop_codon:yes gene_type:complete
VEGISADSIEQCGEVGQGIILMLGEINHTIVNGNDFLVNIGQRLVENQPGIKIGFVNPIE